MERKYCYEDITLEIPAYSEAIVAAAEKLIDFRKTAGLKLETKWGELSLQPRDETYVFVYGDVDIDGKKARLRDFRVVKDLDEWKASGAFVDPEKPNEIVDVEREPANELRRYLQDFAMNDASFAEVVKAGKDASVAYYEGAIADHAARWREEGATSKFFKTQCEEKALALEELLEEARENDNVVSLADRYDPFGMIRMRNYIKQVESHLAHQAHDHQHSEDCEHEH